MNALASKAATAASSAATAVLFPEDWPLYIGVLLGLGVGTLAAWVWSDQTGEPTTGRWVLWQLGTWGLIFVLVLAAQESIGLTTKASMAIAAMGAYLGRDGLQRLRKKSLDKIDKQGS